MSIPIINVKKKDDDVTLPSGVIVPKEVAAEYTPFTIGELLPFKGFWFRVTDVGERTLELEITGQLTGKARRVKGKGKKAHRGRL